MYEVNNTLNLVFSSSLTNLCEINSSFDKAILRIAYAGKNRKKSSISKEVFERCAKTMYNVPLVCSYERETDELGGHDMEVVRNAKGDIRIVNTTTPVGVVPESAHYYWAEAEDENGETHEYLYTEVLLWKRQEAYTKIKNDGITAQSMEISIKEAKKVDGYLEIGDFEFTAFCLIGIEPAYEGASLMFSAQDFKQQMTEMMQDLKESYSMVVSAVGADDIQNDNNVLEGGNGILKEKIELAAQYGIDVDSLDFSLEDFTLEELTEKFEAMKSDNGSAEDPSAEPVNAENFALTQQVTEELIRALSAETIAFEWGDVPKYSYIDCDMEAGEIYAYDRGDWLIYGFTYTTDGDAVKIDFDSKKRKKYAIVDFDGGEQESPIAFAFSEVEQVAKDNIAKATDFEQKFTEMSAKFDEISGRYSALEAEAQELRNFKASVEEANALAEREEVFAQFEDLNGIDAFDNLRENCDGMDAATIKKECFAIRGEFGMTAKFSMEDAHKPVRIKVQKSDLDKGADNKSNPDAPYGGIVEYYAAKSKNR